jgi:hypothetical protein
VIGYGDKENVKCISLKACFNKCRFWCGWCFIMWVSSLWLYHLNEPDEAKCENRLRMAGWSVLEGRW